MDVGTLQGAKDGIDAAEEYEPVDWVGLLRYALIDEKAAPDILEFKDDIVKEVTDLAEQQAQRIAEMESNPSVELERIIYDRDLQRTRWLVKSYYRTRLKKIERHVQYYLHHADYTARLSENELQYAKDYFTSIGRHAQRTILADLPEHFQSFTVPSAAVQSEDMIPAPELHSTVMTRPAYEHAQLTVDPADPENGKMDIQQGDIVVIQYHLIREQLLQEEVHLT